MHNDYKFIAMAIGIFSSYCRAEDYLYNYRGHLMAVFGQMNLKAVRNGFFQNRLDELFVQHAVDKILDSQALQNVPPLDDEDNSMVMMYIQKFSRHITIEFVMSLLKSKGYTRAQIAEHMGVSLPTAQRWAAGTADIKDEDVLRKLFDMYLDTETQPKEGGTYET